MGREFCFVCYSGQHGLKVTLHHRVAGPREITATMRHHLSPPTALMMMTILGAFINYINNIIKWISLFVLTDGRS